MSTILPSGQKTKMLAGELYLAQDAELTAEHHHAQAVTTIFNRTGADEVERRGQLLRDLFAAFGDNTVVKPNFRCDYGYNIRIGARTFINYDCIMLDCNRITIGDDVQIAPGVHIYTATHPIDAQQRREGLEYALPVSIGDGVWLGGRSVICPGVQIGENTIIGAGSVVTGSLPANVVAVGNPCRVLRELNSDPMP